MPYVEHVDVSYCRWKPTDYNVRTGTSKIMMPKPLKHTTRGPQTLSFARGSIVGDRQQQKQEQHNNNMHSAAILSTWWISVPCVYVAPCVHVSASACQLSKLARTESGVDRLKQTHTWCHIHCMLISLL